MESEGLPGYLTGFPAQQELRLVPGDVRDGGEHMCAVHGGALHAVSVVDSSVACLLVQRKLRRQTNISRSNGRF